MIKLLVAVRVILEDDYLRNLELSPRLRIPGEKRLRVIVREPHKWQIGTLAVEIQRAYMSCYQHELPLIKYLKDNEDDCDLDPQLYVSDLLLDEGKAAKDGSDQRVTIKVITEQGRAVREGSIAVGNLLDNPQFLLQHQQTSRPPVPRFPGVSSSLGKRSLPPPDTDTHPTDENGNKRPRQIEIPETQREESILYSIERDAAEGSPELFRAMQQAHIMGNQGSRREQSHYLEPKSESPELWRSFQAIPAATADELEELPGSPHTVASGRRATRDSIDAQQVSESHRPNGALPSAYINGSQAPITPPTEVSTARSTSTKLRSRSQRDGTNLRQVSTASANKSQRRDVYELPESDIDDTQISPGSKQAGLWTGKSASRLPQIERSRSSHEGCAEESNHQLGVHDGLDALDIESVCGGVRVAPQDFITPGISARNSNVPSSDHSEESIYEDAPTDEIRMQDIAEESNLHKRSPPGIQGSGNEELLVSAPQRDGEDGDKENHYSIPTSAQPVSEIFESIVSGKPAEMTGNKTFPVPNPRNNSTPSEVSSAKKKKRRGKRARLSVYGTETSSLVSGSNKTSVAPETPVKATPITKPCLSRRTPSLDSPGEQLSQSLQESARKHNSPNAFSKDLVAERKEPSPARGAGKKHKQNSVVDGLETETSGLSNHQAPINVEEAVREAIKTPGQRKGPKQPRLSKAKEQSAILDYSPGATLVQSSRNGVPSKSPHNGAPSPNSTVNKQRSTKLHQPKTLTEDKPAEWRSSPSAPLGLTEEEIKIMKSREGMTIEQYEAEKKRRREDAHRQAAEQKKREVSAKSRTPAKTATPKTPAKPTVSKTPAKSAVPKTSATPAVPTITTAKSLSELRVAMRNATQNMTSASRTTSKPAPKQSILNASTDDDDSSEDESEDEDSSK